MPKTTLRATLEELNRQLDDLDKTESLDSTNRSEMASIASKIVGLLDDQQESLDEREGLIDRVREADARFEGEHPLLSATLRRIADTLTQIGV